MSHNSGTAFPICSAWTVIVDPVSDFVVGNILTKFGE